MCRRAIRRRASFRFGMWTWKPTWFAALVPLVGCGDDDPAPPPPVGTLLDTIPEGVEPTAIVWSPVGPSVAYWVRVGEKHVLRVNGKEGKPRTSSSGSGRARGPRRSAR